MTKMSTKQVKNILAKASEALHKSVYALTYHDVMAFGLSERQIRKLGGFPKIKGTLFPKTTKLQAVQKAPVKPKTPPKKKESIIRNDRECRVFVIPDLHFPFVNQKALEMVYEMIRKAQPTHVVQLGDLLDQYVFSKYTRSLEITPEDEILSGIEMATTFWKTIQSVVPKAQCFQILGNHDLRRSKRIAERLPELQNLFKLSEWYAFPGVQVMASERDYLVLDGVYYVHGWLSKSIDHAKHFNAPTVHGHRHRPCIETEGRLWSMDCGLLADETSLPMSYTQSKYTKWNMACGIVENGKPHLILL
jgi:predicted phosphodiesterase